MSLGGVFGREEREIGSGRHRAVRLPRGGRRLELAAADGGGTSEGVRACVRARARVCVHPPGGDVVMVMVVVLLLGGGDGGRGRAGISAGEYGYKK